LYLPSSSSAAGSFPLFVWAHGRDATVDYFDSLLRGWAARGYVVAAPTFPLTHLGTAGGSVFDDYVNQPADVSFVISRILALDGPHGTQHPGLVDRHRIAVGGHSLGAATAIAMAQSRCCLDPRVRAVVDIDGAALAFPNDAPVRRRTPLLIVHGDADAVFPVADARLLYAESRAPKYLVIMHGTPHTPFEYEPAHELIADVVGDFLDAYVRRDAAAVGRLLHDATIDRFTSVRHRT
jgi:predicted dienelactone hydrolase